VDETRAEGVASVKIMDRYLLANFLAAYAICFVSMVGLFIVIDLFANADEFLENQQGTIVFVRKIAKYYSLHTFEYFNRLSPIITMVAAMATLSSLHRFNEIVALLAAGIPTKRALIPILAGALLVIGLGVLNREFVLPYFSEPLQRMHENIETEKAVLPVTHMDKDQVLIRALAAHHEDQRIDKVNVTLPMEVVGQLQEVQAKSALYRPDPQTGQMGWRLVEPTAIQMLKANDKIKKLDNGDLFLFTHISFQDMIRNKNWKNFASTSELVALLQGEETNNPNSVRILIHNRVMQPVLNLLLVFLGIPFVLQWERKNVFRGIAIAMGLCMGFFVIDVTSGYFADHGYLDPLMASWVPVFLFGPLAFSLSHRIGT
jgi:lipopolysaccharide export system permease protein